MKTFIFCDMDGTLADNSHRAHLLPAKDDCQTVDKWEAFNQACDQDPYIQEGFVLLESLIWDKHTAIVPVLWSGRSQSVAEKSLAWFKQMCYPAIKICFVHRLLLGETQTCFRANDDHRPARISKAAALTDFLVAHNFDATVDKLICIDDDWSVLEAVHDIYPAAMLIKVPSKCAAYTAGVQSK
jgi:hypothetical protein